MIQIKTMLCRINKNNYLNIPGLAPPIKYIFDLRYTPELCIDDKINNKIQVTISMKGEKKKKKLPLKSGICSHSLR